MKIKTIITSIMIALVLCMAGGYYVWVSALFCVFLSGLICFYSFRQRYIEFSFDLFFIGILIVITGFLLSLRFSIDKSLAPWGIVKFLPLLLFYIWSCALTGEEKRSILDELPLAGSIMTVFSLLMMQFRSMAWLVSVNGRLAGFFQYPNTFAVFLLMAFITAIDRAYKKEQRTESLVYGAICLFGIFMSGSRTVYVMIALLLVFAGVKWLFGVRKNQSEQRSKTNQKKIPVLLFVFILILIAAALFFSRGIWWHRLRSLSFSSSTFLGRLLYLKDAVPIISSHPMGLGYYGYRFIQGSYQSGVYSVVNVHNEIIQLILDIGILPSIFAMICFVSGALRSWKKTGNREKLVAAVLLFHTLADYDLQFLGISMILLLLVPASQVKRYRVGSFSKILMGCVACIIILLCIWIGTADFLYILGQNQKSDRLYSNTLAEIDELTDPDRRMDDPELSLLSEQILERNGYVSLAYAQKAAESFSDGKIKEMAVYQKSAIRTDPYQYVLYTNYMEMLNEAAGSYLENGDISSASSCLVFMKEIPEMLHALEERTSALGWKINDRPTVRLDTVHLEMIDSLEERLSA